MKAAYKRLLSFGMVCLLLVTLLPTMMPTVSAAKVYDFLFPVKAGKLAYKYGYSESYGGTHTGIDIHDRDDDTIYAACAGEVVATANKCEHVDYGKECEHYSTYGNYIKVKHADGTYARYGHLKKDSLKVKKGDKVKKGQAIATMGSSGYSTGKHLHFELRKSNDKTEINVNPLSMNGSISYAYSGYATDPKVTYEAIYENAYLIKSAANNQYLNVVGAKDSDEAKINTVKYTGSKGQVFGIKKAQDGYTLMPQCSTKRVVNPYADLVASGKTVNLYKLTTSKDDCSQWWKFQSSGDGYIIRNVQNPDVCLTTNAAGDKITVKTYTGADNQVWYLEKACTVTYDANGGTGAPDSQRLRAGYETLLSAQKPTRECHTFMGWSTESDDSTAVWVENSAVTIYEDTTVYAVWSVNHSYGDGNGVCSTCGFRDASALRGTVTGSGNTADPVTMCIFDRNSDTALRTLTIEDGNFSVMDLPAGEYKLSFSKLNHVTREYEVTLTGEETALDAAIHLIGDIDGRGGVNVGDVGRLNAHIKGLTPITDEYELLCANVTGDALNMGDVGRMYAHVKGLNPLFE